MPHHDNLAITVSQLGQSGFDALGHFALSGPRGGRHFFVAEPSGQIESGVIHGGGEHGLFAVDASFG